MKRLKLIFKAKKGSAIITVLVVMVVLVMLAQAITMLTLGTLKHNVADASNNEAYYAAESGIVSAIEQLKYEVVSYYQEMSTAAPYEYKALLNLFSTNINTNAQTRFVEPTLESGTTSTTFYVGTYDSANDVCEFNIQCLSMTPDNSKYQVNANVYVKKIDIQALGGQLVVPDNAALVVGGQLDLDYDSAIQIVGGDAYVADITFETFNKNVVPYKIVQGDMYIEPNIGDALNDPFVYSSYLDPDVSNADFTATVDTNINWGDTLTPPSVITTLPGVNLTLSKGFSDSLVYGQGSVLVDNGSYDIELYVDGDLHLDGVVFNGNIYCRGNVYSSSTVITGDIICDGNVSFISGRSDGNIIAGGSVDIQNASSVCNIAAVGDISIESAGVNAGLIYSSSTVSIGNSQLDAVVYACDDVNITGSMYLSGAIFVKDDFYFSNTGAQMNMGYDPEFVKAIIDEANINIFGGNSDPNSVPTLDASVFVSQNITPIGRVN